MADNNNQVSPDAVREEVARLLDNKVFTRSPRLSQFLNFLVDEELAGRGGKINGTQIAIDVYGRDADFDPSIDPVVRVEARRLRRALTSYYHEEGAKNPIHITVPKGGYRPHFTATEAEPEDDGATQLPDITEQLKHLPPVTNAPIVAVLPFRNLGVGEEHQYFAEGFAGSLVVAMSRFDILKVIAPQSTSRYLNKRVDVRVAGRELGARFVLEGKVRIIKDKLRINIALSDAADGGELWGEKFDRDLGASEIYHLEDELVASIVGIISDINGVIPKTLTPEADGKPAENLSTYEAILAMLVYFNRYDRKDFLPARKAMQAAHKREPKLHTVISGLTMLYAEDYLRSITGNSKDPQEAWEMANQAVSLGPESPGSHLARAQAAFICRKPEIAIQEADTAMKLNPNSASLCGFAAHCIGMSGELERGIKILERLRELNPYFPSWLLSLSALNHYMNEDYDQALAVAEQFTLDQWPGKPFSFAAILAQLGRTDEAAEQLKLLKKMEPGFKKDPHGYISRNFLFDEQVEKITEGITKAGL